jgi:Tfp pilus assembly protein PilN
MIEINLLPEELRRVEKARKVKINLAMSAGVALTVAVLILVIVLSVVGRRMSSQARIRARLKTLDGSAKEAEALIKENQKIEKEIGSLEKFAAHRLLWNRCLNEVSDAIPDDLFIIKLDYNSRKPFTMSIRGEAVSGRGGEGVVDFIDNLHRSPVIGKEFPKINYSIESIQEGRKSFEIRCTKVQQEK